MRMTPSGKSKRSFAIESVKDKKGCDISINYGSDNPASRPSSNPASAAKKALTQFCRAKNLKGPYQAFITVRETTQNSKKNSYSYNVKREKAKEIGPFGNEFVNVAKSMKGKTIPKCSTKSSNKKKTKKAKK